MIGSSWHTKTVVEVSDLFDTDNANGLSENIVSERLQEYGKNKLPSPPKKSKWKILINQFNDILIYILIVAAIVTLVLAFVNNPNDFSIEYFFDTIVIVIVLVINAGIGFYEEIKAEKAINSLQSLVSEYATVYREGKLQVIPASDLVPGDLIEFNPGERISADIRLIETQNVKIKESALTGESFAVSKSSKSIFEETTPVGDRKNMAFMGTIVETGKGKGIVVATGISTEVGQISALVSNIGRIETPLQRKLEHFSGQLAKAIIAISIFLIIFGATVEYIHSESRENFLETLLGLTIVGVSLAVAAIPEGLPIILTFTLAISVQKMAKQNSIIRNLEAVETLGSTTVIATDKTGTLTQNKLNLIKLITRDSTMNVWNNEPIANTSKSVGMLFSIMEATTAGLSKLENTNGEAENIIDPLDIAVYEVVDRYEKRKLRQIEDKEYIYELPFDSDRKMMSVVSKQGENLELNLKGAPDVVLSHSVSFLSNGEEIEFTEQYRNEFSNRLDQLAQEGYRVIGCAYRPIKPQEIASDDVDSTQIEKDLVFVGFLTFIDPPRPEVFDALKSCYTAGIDVIMITGDHPQTALAISKQLNIVEKSSNNVLIGSKIDELDDTDLSKALQDTRVFARVSPSHKLRLVSILKERGEVVGMTGDGVNDSPALVKADIGVAMGIAGTDAAKEASDMILLDDNFATLVSAVEEGRVVNDNIRKFTNYLLASNTSEVLFLIFGFFTIAALQPLLIRELIPISETQILYLNLVTDSFLALALGLERKERNVMKNDPISPDTPIVTKSAFTRIIFIGVLLAIVSTALFFVLLGSPDGWADLNHKDIAYAQSFTLTFLVLSEVFIAVSYRSKQPIFSIGFWSNRVFILSILAILVAQIAILYIPILNSLFDTTPLSVVDWVIILIGSSIIFAILELSKSKITEHSPGSSRSQW